MKDRAKYDINANSNSKAQYEHARTTWNMYQKWKMEKLLQMQP